MSGNKHDNGVHEIGTEEMKKAYMEDTPGQMVERYIEESKKKNDDVKQKLHFGQKFDNPLKGFPYNEAVSPAQQAAIAISKKEKGEKPLEEDSFEDKSKKSGISVGTLKKVYKRGVAAWKTGHRPGTTPEQWGHARVNAFIVKKKKGNLNHDKDLA